MIAILLAALALGAAPSATPPEAEAADVAQGAPPGLAADSPIAPPPLIPSPAGVTLATRPELRWSNPTPIGQFALHIGRTLLRPVMPELSDAWVLVPAAIGTAILMAVDVPVYLYVRGLPEPSFAGQRLSTYVSYLGEGAVDLGIFGAIGILGGSKGQRVAIEGLEALAAAGIFSRLFKLVFRLQRPSWDGYEKHWFSENIFADAFPSGHAMTAFAMAAVIGSEYPISAPFVYALAAYVGVARVQAATHWASDVVVGAALGMLFGWEAVRLNKNLRLSPLSVGDGAGAAISGQF